MDKIITNYWQKLAKRYSANQVFFILVYWMLSVYQQVVGKQNVPKDIDEWRSYLLSTFKESLNYDLKESAVRLSERIEWSVLVDDTIAIGILEYFTREVTVIFHIADNQRDADRRLEQMMEMLLHIAAVNTLYSTTPESIRNVVKSIFSGMNIISMADLCCGSGGLGIAVWQQLNEPAKVVYQGMDIEPVLCDICALMTHICGISESRVMWKDILKNKVVGSYDLVLLDVPRGQNKTVQVKDYGEWLQEVRQKNIYADWIYVLRVLDAMNDVGKAAVIVTSGTLTRRNEVELRKRVIKSDWVEAVITLPVNLYPDSRVGSEVIIFNKNKERKREKKLLFIDISKYYFRDNRNYYSISQEGIELVGDIFHRYYEQSGISSIADTKQIEENDWSLKPMRYIERRQNRDRECLTLCLQDVAEILRGVQLKKDEEDILCQSGDALYLNIKDIHEERIHYEGARKITPKSNDWQNKFRIKEDDILITSKGTGFKIAIVEQNPPEAYICGNLTLLRVNPKRYDPYILFEYLISEKGIRALDSIQSGTTIRVLSNGNLANLEIPMFHTEVMNRVGTQLKEKRRKYEAETKRITEAYEMERRTLLELVGIRE